MLNCNGLKHKEKEMKKFETSIGVDHTFSKKTYLWID
jgi:hypothetical protein